MGMRQNNSYTDVCNRLKAVAAEASFKIKLTKENLIKDDLLKKRLALQHKQLHRYASALAMLKQLQGAILEYTTERRKRSAVAIKQAVHNAGNIVPASDRGVNWVMDDGEAWFATADGRHLDRTEGSGFKSTLSMFMRDTILRLNPKYLNFLLLDEIFAKLSAERSTVLATYLSLLGERMQIISIEQKPEVFEDIPCTSYRFTLDGDTTKVVKES
jgi:hypothetical protein